MLAKEGVVMGQRRKYAVVLTSEQRARLAARVKNGPGSAKQLLHARILLMSDAAHPEGGWTDVQIAAALGVHRNTVARIRRRFAERGEAAALNRRPYPPHARPPKLDGAAEA